MTLVIHRVSARVSVPDLAVRLHRALAEHGREGVIRQAQDRYRSAFTDAGFGEPTGDGDGGRSPSALSRLRAAQLELLAVAGDDRPLLAGDFFPAGEQGILYVLAHGAEGAAKRRTEGSFPSVITVEVGYIGDTAGSACLDSLLAAVTAAFDEPPVWDQIGRAGAQFVELTSAPSASFVSGSTITADDIRLADALEQPDVRQAAIAVRRAGNLLAPDLEKRLNGAGTAAYSAEQLVGAGLLSREFVVVCGQSSHQVNRLRTRDVLTHMAAAGVLCSCGRPIEQERVEEILVPTPELQRMLDQSFWTTARLVRALRHVGVSDDRVVLNRQEGADEIDAFVDVHGSLLMFELKDNEFSMGHAYPFGGRIAQYRPDYAFIVSTKGIAADVKEYFGRVRPQTQLVYVDTLASLEDKLLQTVTQVRSRVAARILNQLDALAVAGAPLTHMAGARLQLQLPADDRSRLMGFPALPRLYRERL